MVGDEAAMLLWATRKVLECPVCCGTGRGDFEDPTFLYDFVKPCQACEGSGIDTRKYTEPIKPREL